MENYFQNFSSLIGKLEKENRSLYSRENLFHIFEDKFNRAVNDNPPPEIHGNWRENQDAYRKLSLFFFDPAIEDPVNIAPREELLHSKWINIAPFARKEHAEFLWFLEKNRFLMLGIVSDSNLSTEEKILKDRAHRALETADRSNAFNLLKKAISRFPDDFTLYGDIAFLFLNDKHDIRSAAIHFENSCKMLLKKKSFMFCFLKLQINMIYQLENDFFNAYATTQKLLQDFGAQNEGIYQHGINSLNIKKIEEGISCLKTVCKNDINYTLKAYEEESIEEYRSDLKHIFRELAHQQEIEFKKAKRSIEASISEAERLGIGEWGKEVIPSLQADMAIINSLGHSGVYVNTAAAQYFIRKTPEVLISKAVNVLAEVGEKEVRENNETIIEKRKDLNENLIKHKKYNMLSLILLVLITTVFFISFNIYRGFLFALAFCIIFISILLIAVGFNIFYMSRLKSITTTEIERLDIESTEITHLYNEEIKAFKTKIRKVAEE